MSNNNAVTQVKIALEADLDRYKDEGEWKPISEIKKLLGTKKEIPNPEPAPQVPITLTIGGLMDQLGDDTIKEFESVVLSELADAVRSQDTELITMWMRIGVARAKLTPEQQATVEGIMGMTIPDPNHPATIVVPTGIKKRIDNQIISEAIAELEV